VVQKVDVKIGKGDSLSATKTTSPTTPQGERLKVSLTYQSDRSQGN